MTKNDKMTKNGQKKIKKHTQKKTFTWSERTQKKCTKNIHNKKKRTKRDTKKTWVKKDAIKKNGQKKTH